MQQNVFASLIFTAHNATVFVRSLDPISSYAPLRPFLVFDDVGHVSSASCREKRREGGRNRKHTRTHTSVWGMATLFFTLHNSTERGRWITTGKKKIRQNKIKKHTSFSPWYLLCHSMAPVWGKKKNSNSILPEDVLMLRRSLCGTYSMTTRTFTAYGLLRADGG
jgi:hypothetical protein